MYLLNGKSEHCIEFSDRGFQYGDGLFETIEIKNGSPVFLTQHLQRLFKGCDRLLIPRPNSELIKKEVLQLIQSAPESKQAVLKLMLTRGSGGRGYRQPDTVLATRLLSLHPFPEYPENYSLQGINVRFCQSRLGLNPVLAGIKHMNRLEQVIARAEWSDPDIQEGLMLDMNDHVVEGTMTNLFVVKNQVLYTPLIEHCGVEGVIRNILIMLAKRNQIQVVQKTITKEELYSADELFVTNSIIGIWPIKQIEIHRYKAGLLTKRFQRIFAAYKLEVIHDC